MWISEAERQYQAGQEAAFRRAKLANKKRKRIKGTLHRKKALKRERVNAWKRCQKYLTESFWPAFNGCTTREQRMDAAKAAIKLNWWVSSILRNRLRREYFKIRGKLLNHLEPKTECGICQADYATQKHHIVMIAYGGYNCDDNILKICWTCHEEIHPWMKDTN